MESLATHLPAGSERPLGRRERKKLEMRTALHRAALELFAEKGFRQTRISEISDAADVSESTFFRYFDSKEGVALEGIRQRGEAIVAAVCARPDDESPIDACLAVNVDEAMQRHLVTAEDLPGLELLRETPELVSNAHLILGRTVTQLAEEFARRLGRDAVGIEIASIEIRVQAHAVIAASIAALEVWIEDPAGSNLQRLIHQALTRLRDGLRSTAVAADAADSEARNGK